MNLQRILRNVALGTAATFAAVSPAAVKAQFSLSIAVNLAPPPLPVYVQPQCPAPNYIWTPGFWAYDEYDGYYWVPGTWVAAPEPGLLWTPGYWGYGDGGGYLWHTGYWGPHVGFYGGINYGFGYTGVGFGGGEWRGGSFAYNTAVMNVNRTNITNVYVDRTVINNTTVIDNNNIHTSFNGGANGIQARPTPQQQAFSREQHVQATPMQAQNLHVAAQDRSNFASANHGAPVHAAIARPVSSPAELNRMAVPARAAAPMVNGNAGNERGFGNTAAAQPGARSNTGVQPALNGQPRQPGQPMQQPAQNYQQRQPTQQIQQPAPNSPQRQPMQQPAQGYPQRQQGAQPAQNYRGGQQAQQPAQTYRQSPAVQPPQQNFRQNQVAPQPAQNARPQGNNGNAARPQPAQRQPGQAPRQERDKDKR